MSDDAGEATTADTQPPADWAAEAPATDGYLRSWLDLAELQVFSPYLTLSVPGGLISGRLTSTAGWLRATVDAIKLPPGREPDVFMQNMRTAADDAEARGRARPDDAPGPWFVHLVEAQYAQAGVFAPAQGGVAIRVRLSEVTGWSMGRMGPTPPAE